MAVPTPTQETHWEPLAARAVASLFGESSARWWLSGGVALDHWIGRPIRERPNTDVSTTTTELGQLVNRLPEQFSAWIPVEEDVAPWGGELDDIDLQPVRIQDNRTGAWALQVNIEDGTDEAWLYRRDPRLQLPWDRAVRDIDGIPTGAPEVQLVWKALRPRPQDELDKDAVLPKLSADARSWWEHAILSTHPHSSWAIHVRSPDSPAKASWNQPQR